MIRTSRCLRAGVEVRVEDASHQVRVFPNRVFVDPGKHNTAKGPTGY